MHFFFLERDQIAFRRFSKGYVFPQKIKTCRSQAKVQTPQHGLHGCDLAILPASFLSLLFTPFTSHPFLLGCGCSLQAFVHAALLAQLGEILSFPLCLAGLTFAHPGNCLLSFKRHLRPCYLQKVVQAKQAGCELLPP